MSLAAVRGQTAAVRVLGRALETGRVPSAFLFSGPAGVGKRTTARAFCAALVCDARSASGACGTCRACRKVAHGTHPDLIVVETLADKKEIAVEQVRQEIVAHMAYSPYEAARRAVLLPASDELSLSAENALLRSMEEPGAHTHFVLVSSEAHRLLPTVRSRCQEVRFVPLADALVVELLEARGVAPADARRAAAFSGGSVGGALRRLEGDLASHVATAEGLEAAAGRGLRALVETAGRVAKEQKESLPGILEAWLLLRRDLLRAGEGAEGEALLLASDSVATRARAVAMGPGARLRGLAAVHDAILALERYANAELVLDRALLEIGR
jgi:DNA polymerase III subunit delta'